MFSKVNKIYQIKRDMYLGNNKMYTIFGKNIITVIYYFIVVNKSESIALYLFVVKLNII